ncbi:MAG: GH32 C-terminal domain-containing protein [Planctomyces sp.]|nr:GH32 C-terminal domain-containing protein [Planctomyces sp.]
MPPIRRPFRISIPALWTLVGLASIAGVVQSAPPPGDEPFLDKTLVVWTTLANTAQRSGAVLTLENPPSEFDALLLGEIAPGKWMAGSDYFRRTQRQQDGFPVETAAPDELLQLAIICHGREITFCRNGEIYSTHTSENPPIGFNRLSRVLFGLHHTDAFGSPGFAGTIDDARIYDRALTLDELRALRPNQASNPPPLGWWTFEDSEGRDQMGNFPAGQLVGQARIAEGRLDLFGGYFLVGSPRLPTRDDVEWPTWHVHAKPEEGLARPYDANGCIFKDGVYHLMYIYQDRRRPHDGHSWGHLTSVDLVNWKSVEPALLPEPGDPDIGIFSGNAFLGKDGQPMLCWFGVNAGVCVATAGDAELRTWTKHPANPVIPMTSAGGPAFGRAAGQGTYFVWDPFMWFENDTYYCLLGGNAMPDGKDTLFLMKSRDLTTWEPLHPFYEQPDRTWTVPGEDCSCPDFFPLGDKHVLLCISHSVGGRCYIGRYENEKFYPEQHVRMNWPGGNFFAPESLVDDRGRRIFWAWVTDPRLITTQVATGSGVMSLPREMRLGDDGRLKVRPVQELESLRAGHRRLAGIELPADRDVTLPVPGTSLELTATLDCGQAREIGLKVRCAADGSEETVIVFSTVEQRLTIDVSKSTLRQDVNYAYHPLDSGGLRHPRGERHLCPATSAPCAHPADQPLRLRVFLDGPLLEVFANDELCLTQQVFPLLPGSVEVRAFARGGSGRLIEADAWEMRPATFE